MIPKSKGWECFIKNRRGMLIFLVRATNKQIYWDASVGDKQCANIFEDDIFLKQIRKREKITYEAIKRHLNKYKHR